MRFEAGYDLDPSGVIDNSRILQNIIDGTPRGKTFEIPYGIFKITTPLNIDRDEITIKGEGSGTVIYQATVNTHAINLAKATGETNERWRVNLKHLSVLGGPGCGEAISGEEVHHSIFEDLYLRSGTSGTGTGKGLHLKHCYWTKIEDIKITANIPPIGFPLISTGIPKYGIYVEDQCNILWMRNLVIDSCTDAIYFAGPAASQGGMIDGAYLASNSGYAINGLNGSIVGWTLSNINPESNTLGDIAAYNWVFSAIKNSRCRINFGSSCYNNEVRNNLADYDAAYKDSGRHNKWINCGQMGQTMPDLTGSQDSVWQTLVDASTWPYVVLIP